MGVKRQKATMKSQRRRLFFLNKKNDTNKNHVVAVTTDVYVVP